MPSRCHAKRLVRNRSIATAYLAATVLSVSACAVGPDFETPGAVVQNTWIEKHDSRVETKTGVKSLWWRAFKDPTLDELIERAAEQNLPVQIAGLRILEARAQLGVCDRKHVSPESRGLWGCANRETQLAVAGTS
jgi:hypothetical protein